MTPRPRPPLSREAIVDASIVLLHEQGDDGFTMRRLGDALGADPTAVYRHFRDKGDLLRAVGDRLLHDVPAGLDERSPDAWRHTVIEVCTRLREVLLRHPQLAITVRDAPPLDPGEFAITELLVQQFLYAGLPPRDAALAYHGVIELSVGSAAIDAAIDSLDVTDREQRYTHWRRTYATLPADRFPAIHAVAGEMYRGTATERFVAALERLLDGLAVPA